MRANEWEGKLIVLEGLDGAGTTTQSHLLARFLRDRGYATWTTREPSDGPAGTQIRTILRGEQSLSSKRDPQNKAMAALFAADRLDHLYARNGVIERLQRGEWVIMDRYYLSSFAYQTIGMSPEEEEWLSAMHEYCIQPDITLFLDVPAMVSITRIASNRGFHFELFESHAVLDNVRAQYFVAIDKFRGSGDRIFRLDGTESVQRVQSKIDKYIKLLFFDDAFIPQKDEAQVWRWRILHKIRTRAEEELKLSYFGTKTLPPTVNPDDGSSGNNGGYQLVFVSPDDVKYHVLVYFKGHGQDSITFPRALGRAGETLKRLNELCRETGRQSNPSLFPGG
jgi:dTMP kinase